MNRLLSLGAILIVLGAGGPGFAEPALTIYNQNFAVVRESVPLQLEKGVNEYQFNDITAHVEPDSVMLRDPAGKRMLRILEQNYRADPVSQELLLSFYEGDTIDFLRERPDGTDLVSGTIVRSAYVPHQAGMQRYGQGYRMAQSARAHGAAGQPIIEVDGKLRFGLPGVPLFPALADDTVLKPTLSWVLESGDAGPLDAELCYVTGGMSWEASYNLVTPEKGDVLDVVGWVTMDNQTGKTFADARVKLMAGDVSKLQEEARRSGYGGDEIGALGYLGGGAPPVTEKAFDEYHLYALQRLTTLHDRETKQVEFIRTSGVDFERFYVYDGLKIDANRYRGWNMESIRQDQNYGTESNPKVWTMCEFKNTKENGLGIPLPKGRTRFYRRDDDGQLEFTGENIVDHTPRGETVRVYVGNAFDLVGERRRTNYKMEHQERRIDEDFEIRLRNRKKEPVEIRVIEHLYRWHTWNITASSAEYEKMDSQQVVFRVTVEPDEERVVTYSVRYTW